MNLPAFLCLAALALFGYLGKLIYDNSGGGGWALDTPRDKKSPLAFDNPMANALALPLAFGLAWLLKDVWWALGFLFHGPCHETGHALVGWLGGHWAFPDMVAWTSMSQDTSPIVIGIVALTLGTGLYFSWRWRSPVLFLLCAALGAAQVYLTFFASPQEHMHWFIFGGCAGELVVPTLIIWAFYQRLSDRLRWDFFRYPFLVAAMCTLVMAAHRWADVDERKNFFAANAESGADMTKLQPRWTQEHIITIPRAQPPMRGFRVRFLSVVPDREAQPAA